MTRSVVYDVKLGLSRNLAFVVKNRTMESHAVSLPFTGPAGGVYEGLGPAVKSAALSVRIGDVIVGIKNLNFVLSHEKDSAVALPLTTSFGYLGRREFDAASDKIRTAPY